MKLVKSFLLFLFVMNICLLFNNPLTAHAVTNDLTKRSISDIGLTMDDDGFKVDLGVSKSEDAWNQVFRQYKKAILGVSGIGAMTMLLFFINQFIKLGASAGNPQARTQAIAGVIWTGLATTGLGAVTVLVGFFYNAI